jgi:ribosomal protein S12 methylthiotransferase
VKGGKGWLLSPFFLYAAGAPAAAEHKRRAQWATGALRPQPLSIPSTKKTQNNSGTFRSKPWAALLAEARALVEAGALELCLIAEDTNQYGSDLKDGSSLAALLKELTATLPTLRWIRLLYCYPSYFDEALIAEIAANPKVCKYVDMPLQHVHNLTLLAMARPPRAHADALLNRLRAGIPGLALRTTFISGFPGETDAAHRELVDFCADFKFERMGAFAYSAEDGTPAASLPDQVHPDTRAARRDELVALQQDIGAAFAERLIGTEVDVLVDGYDEDGALVGRTQWDAPDVDPIVFLGDPDPEFGVAPAEPGQMRRCVVTGASLFDLEATPVSWEMGERDGEKD